MHDKLHFLSRAGYSRVLLLLGISILLPGITAQDWKWVGNSSTLYVPRVTNINFLLTIYRRHEEERLWAFNDYQRKIHWSFFFKFSQLILRKIYRVQAVFSLPGSTVFIRISAQPRISAHLEWAPILKAEKVNKRPASNKRPPHHTFLPLPLELKLATTPKIE